MSNISSEKSSGFFLLLHWGTASNGRWECCASNSGASAGEWDRMSFPESLAPITGEETSLNASALVTGEKEPQSPPMPACQAQSCRYCRWSSLRPGKHLIISHSVPTQTTEFPNLHINLLNWFHHKAVIRNPIKFTLTDSTVNYLDYLSLNLSIYLLIYVSSI